MVSAILEELTSRTQGGGPIHFVIMRTHYEIELLVIDDLWHAHRVTPGALLVGTGTTLRDALDELALQLERERQEHDNAPH